MSSTVPVFKVLVVWEAAELKGILLELFGMPFREMTFKGSVDGFHGVI